MKTFAIRIATLGLACSFWLAPAMAADYLTVTSDKAEGGVRVYRIVEAAPTA